MPQLPSRPDLDRLKRQARALQRAAQAGAPDALARLRACFADVDPQNAKLAQAQTVLAREYGAPSWPSLAARVEERKAKRIAREARAAERAADARRLADLWLERGRAGEVTELLRVFHVGKGRAEAARALMRQDSEGMERLVETLLTGLSHPAIGVRFESAHALDTWGDQRCVPHLVALFDDPAPKVRWMAMHALSCHACCEETCVDDPAILQRIADAARSDESRKVRFHASIALGLSGGPAGVHALRALQAEVSDAKQLQAIDWALRKATRDGRSPNGLADEPAY